jgi:hypothetical protein
MEVFSLPVIPAKAEIQRQALRRSPLTPAFAGVTNTNVQLRLAGE